MTISAPNRECEKLRSWFGRRKPPIAAWPRMFCKSRRQNFPMRSPEPLEIFADSKIIQPVVPDPEVVEEQLGLADQIKTNQ